MSKPRSLVGVPCIEGMSFRRRHLERDRVMSKYARMPECQNAGSRNCDSCKCQNSGDSAPESGTPKAILAPFPGPAMPEFDGIFRGIPANSGIQFLARHLYCGLGTVTVHTAPCGPNSYKQVVIAIACRVQCVYVLPVVWHVVTGCLLISAKSLAPGGGYCACSVDMCEQ
jgi:hypothetical protein